RAHLTSDGHGDRSRHLARIVEQAHFEGFSLDETVSLCLDRPGTWAEKYDTNQRLIEDVERCFSKYAAPKDAEKQANAHAAEQFVQAKTLVSPFVRPPLLTPPRHDLT